VAATAWAIVVGGTDVPLIVGTAAFDADPNWILTAQVVPIGALLALTVVDERFRPLQSLGLAILAVKLIQAVTVVDLLGSLGITLSSQGAGIVSILFRGFVALALLGVLLVRGHDRGSLFLARSDLSATAVPELVTVPRSESPWWLHGTITGTVVLGATTLVLVLGGATFAAWTVPPGELLRIAGLVTVGAAVNAFAEEFVFRAAPLSDLEGALEKNHAMVLLGALFGLSHYYGTPGGVAGVLMASFLGWWLTKSMLETRGTTFAWAVHFLLDVVIFSAFLLP